MKHSKFSTPAGRVASATLATTIKRSHRAYVLLVVLFVLALAAVAVASICRMSLEKAVQASRAQADLQRHWATVTCRSVLLPKAEDLFLQSPHPKSEIHRDIVLNGQPITLIFGDEQAKANINLIYAQAGIAATEREVRTIVGSSGGFVPVEIHPIPDVGQSFGSVDATGNEQRAFESFEQVFPLVSPENLVSSRNRRWSLASRLTCWGDGSLNFHRAADESVRAVLSRHLTAAEISRLLDARKKDPDAPVADLLDMLALPDPRREPVENILTDQSFCHSLWIMIDSRGRVDYDLSISEGAAVTLYSW